MIYVPNTQYQCYVIQNSDTIRAYKTQPYVDSNIQYIDYYINSHYMEKEGTQRFNNSVNVECISKEKLTDDFYYRNDLSDILLSFTLLILICFGIPLMLIKRFLRKM